VFQHSLRLDRVLELWRDIGRGFDRVCERVFEGNHDGSGIHCAAYRWHGLSDFLLLFFGYQNLELISI